jgi:outer membrane protein insertion porin family
LLKKFSTEKGFHFAARRFVPSVPRLLTISAAVISALSSSLALAFDPFVVRDIRVEGVQRTEPGTVFSYLPVRVGEQLTQEKAAAAVKALFATGFYKDVRLEVEQDVLVVFVEERPAIGSLDFSGNKEFDKDQLKRALRDIGLADGRVFDRAALEKAEQEIKRQYLSKSFYDVKVTATVAPLERNRVAIAIAIEENDKARIAEIRINGTKAFQEKDLLDEMKLSHPGWMSWYTRNDQYSREKLNGDLDALRSYYMNRGYLEYAVESTQVTISPDKSGVFISININEGPRYTVKSIKLGGELLGREAELGKLIKLQAGDVFSSERLSESTTRISEALGQLGYAFAAVNAVPEVNREKAEVDFQVLVDPGKRVYVRRINIAGNAKTRDEVIRREFKQLEGSWYDGDAVRQSRDRVDRLGHFKEVSIDAKPVADSPDQVDILLTVSEKPSGNFFIGVGFSRGEKFSLLGSVTQDNFLGSGRNVTLALNTSSANRNVSISVVDPYFTDDGVSSSTELYRRDFIASSLGLGDYTMKSAGAGFRLGVPISDTARVSGGLAYERNQLVSTGGSIFSIPPNLRSSFTAGKGNEYEPVSGFIASVGYGRDTRDSAITPTKGNLQSLSLESSLPTGELRFARIGYQVQQFWPISRDYTFAVNADLGYGKALSGKPYPGYKNYYVGGIGSVRAFALSSLGQCNPSVPGNSNSKASSSSTVTYNGGLAGGSIDGTCNTSDSGRISSGGQVKAVANVEVLFPLPGTGNDRSFRMFWFADAGNVFTAGNFEAKSLRYASGVGITWLSPIGPLKLSYGLPLNRQPYDRVQKFQFQVGTGF